jgi:putative ABC transport system permease protein
VAEVAWVKRQIVQVVYGNQNWATSGQGVTPSYHTVRDWPVVAGRFFDERDQAGASPMALLGQTVVDNLFAPGEDPVGATIRVKNVPFEVIGVLSRKGLTTWGQDQDDVVLMPFSTAERRTLGTQILGTVDMIYVSTASSDAVEEAERQVREILHERHRIQPNQDDDFTVLNLNEIAETSKMASRVMTNLLLSVASISLLVGGIGIMNIMLVSVTERTREIGIRMAVGARTRHILVQFLVEAIVVSTFGGLIGVAVGLLGTSLIARLAEWPTLVSGSAIAVAFSFSAAVGIVFGFYPAKRAAALDPITALRSE